MDLSLLSGRWRLEEDDGRAAPRPPAAPWASRSVVELDVLEVVVAGNRRSGSSAA